MSQLSGIALKLPSCVLQEDLLVTSWLPWLSHKFHVALRAFMNTKNLKCLFSSVALFAAFIHFTGSVIYFNIHVLQKRRFVLNLLIEKKNTFKFGYKCDDNSAIIFNGTKHKTISSNCNEEAPRLWVANFCNNIGRSLFSFIIINHGFLNIIRRNQNGGKRASSFCWDGGRTMGRSICN